MFIKNFLSKTARSISNFFTPDIKEGKSAKEAVDRFNNSIAEITQFTDLGSLDKADKALKIVHESCQDKESQTFSPDQIVKDGVDLSIKTRKVINDLATENNKTNTYDETFDLIKDFSKKSGKYLGTTLDSQYSLDPVKKLFGDDEIGKTAKQAIDFSSKVRQSAIENLNPVTKTIEKTSKVGKEIAGFVDSSYKSIKNEEKIESNWKMEEKLGKLFSEIKSHITEIPKIITTDVDAISKKISGKEKMTQRLAERNKQNEDRVRGG